MAAQDWAKNGSHAKANQRAHTTGYKLLWQASSLAQCQTSSAAVPQEAPHLSLSTPSGRQESPKALRAGGTSRRPQRLS